MNEKPVFAAPASISIETHRKTAQYVDQRREFSTFNNCVVVGRGSAGWLIRATRAAAEGISRLGFDVFNAGDVDAYHVRRHFPYTVRDEQGRVVDPGNGYRPYPSTVDA